MLHFSSVLTNIPHCITVLARKVEALANTFQITNLPPDHTLYLSLVHKRVCIYSIFKVFIIMKSLSIQNYIVSSILILMLIFSYLYKINEVEFFADESQWIGSSQVFEEFFTTKFNSSYFDESYWTLTQPPLTRYVIGFGRRLGGYTWEDINKTWDFALTVERNEQRGAMPSPGLLWWSRLPMAILAIMSFVLIFVLFQHSLGVVTGYVWLLFGITNSYFLLHLRRAMGESVLLFSVVLVLIICYLVLLLIMRQQHIHHWKRKLFFLLVSLGISIGISGNTKLNGLSVGLIGLFLVIVIVVKYQAPLHQKLKLGTLSLMVIIFCSTATFIGINPYLWPEPITRTQKMLKQRLHEMSDQQKNIPEDRISSFQERMHVIPKQVFVTHAPIGLQNGFIISIFLFVLGFFFIIKHVIRSAFDSLAGIAMVSILAVGLVVVTPSLLTPLNWERYYLFPIFFQMIIASIGFGVSIQTLRQEVLSGQIDSPNTP